MKIPHLKDTCLCAIVRDEMINPAGGIANFIDSIVPYMESAVIIDTGSRDGTKQVLFDAQKKYPNLIVKGKKFRGFANARNYSLKIGRKYSPNALVLDADERFTIEDISSLEQSVPILYKNPTVWLFDFMHIRPDGKLDQVPEWNQRLFPNQKNIKFDGKIYETLQYSIQNRYIACVPDNSNQPFHNPKIKHFLPGQAALTEKKSFYTQLGLMPSISPSAYENFHLWKEVNPHSRTFEAHGLDPKQLQADRGLGNYHRMNQDGSHAITPIKHS